MSDLTIELTQETDRRLAEEAERHGRAKAEHARILIERGLAASPDPEWRERLQRIVSEFRHGVAEAAAAGEDVSPEAIEAAITQASAEVREERLARARRR
jgi:predicted transcriptional regulator